MSRAMRLIPLVPPRLRKTAEPNRSTKAPSEQANLTPSGAQAASGFFEAAGAGAWSWVPRAESGDPNALLSRRAGAGGNNLTASGAQAATGFFEAAGAGAWSWVPRAESGDPNALLSRRARAVPKPRGWRAESGDPNALLSGWLDSFCRTRTAERRLASANWTGVISPNRRSRFSRARACPCAAARLYHLKASAASCATPVPCW